ncbi:MAG: phospho-sugar mutase [Ruminococcus sp.]
MNYFDLYNEWLKNATDDAELTSELVAISGDEEKIHDRFYRQLEFGTAGLRGVLGAGTNRMNIYVVRQATQGLANYVNKQGGGSVAISHDSRINASLFMQEAARVLAANGIKVYITKELEPTPVLSYLVRHFKCRAGIMITASHNPAVYNGYKAYGEDGCQMTDASASAVYKEICSIDMFTGVKLCDLDEAAEKGMVEYVDDSVYTEYLSEVLKQQINPGVCKDSGVTVAYTPLNGTGNKLVRRALAEIGVENVAVVKEQELPDGNFTTCSFPNPELAEAMEYGLKLASETGADVLLATDPDADRVGIAAPDSDGSYRLITGNEVGIMLADYILKCRLEKGTLPENPVIVKTIVSTKLVTRICEHYGCALKDVLTGFKYIGEVILGLEEKGEEDRFIFGFEESSGYLAGTYVRDKDAVVASMLIAEMTAYYKKQGKTLCRVLDSLYHEYGYYYNKTLNFYFEGAEGMKKMSDIMTSLRENAPTELAGYKVVGVSDYQQSVSIDKETGKTETIDLPRSNVLSYALEGGNAAIVRPSGTEPKIKLYLTSVGKDKDDALTIMANIEKSAEALLEI